MPFLPGMNSTQLMLFFVGSMMPETLRFLVGMHFFATSRRHTPALKGLRNIAQGQPSLSEATLGIATHDRKQTQRFRHTQRSPAASAKNTATCRASRQLQKLTITALN
jgi:hypothetical protein